MYMYPRNYFDKMATEVDSQRIVTSSIVVPATAKRHVEETNDAPAAAHGRKRSTVEELDNRRQNNDDVTMEGAESTRTNSVTKRPRLDTTNPDVRKRGQRMFANILGTLTKFKNEAQHKSEAEIKREQIEQKLQEKLKRERDELSSKMRREEEQRKAKLIEQKRLDEERKINEVRNATRKQRSRLANFLLTDAVPRLHYLPAKLTDDMTRQIESQRAKVADQLHEEEEQDRERERERQEKMELDGGTAGGGEIGAQEASEEKSGDVEMVERDAAEPEETGDSPKRSDEDRQDEERSASVVNKEPEEKSSPTKEELDVKENDKKEHGDPPANGVEMSSLMGPGGDVVDYEVEDADEEGK
ncbi:pinin/SDK/memA/ protein conserved region-domain-containing protein [Endogone sp. FLAS-F59071]|nr:pinin/SDK/memA/ protein conserved region-domain-containing protein [Endogone sp. FLAS-F59071]|eukprot:RUS18472.1 pinin/SDK/memA/ protein conserved region-domain-containing protein [Endogone sp. FLAS-F59071]